MAAHNILCSYREVKQNIGGFPALPDGGIYTGHHLIPDHCFMISFGVRGGSGSLTVVPHYSEMDAPVIVVTADANGGKSREHGVVHSSFDPEEGGFVSAKQWTYAEAREAAIESVFHLLDKITVGNHMDKYFKHTLGMDDYSMVRAGERSVFPGYQAVRSSRAKTKAQRFSPY